MQKKAVWSATKRCMIQLALALVCNFYLIRTFVNWNIKAQARPVSYGVFLYFNKVWSCKILTCICHEVLPPWPRDSLP